MPNLPKTSVTSGLTLNVNQLKSYAKNCRDSNEYSRTDTRVNTTYAVGLTAVVEKLLKHILEKTQKLANKQKGGLDEIKLLHLTTVVSTNDDLRNYFMPHSHKYDRTNPYVTQLPFSNLKDLMDNVNSDLVLSGPSKNYLSWLAITLVNSLVHQSFLLMSFKKGNTLGNRELTYALYSTLKVNSPTLMALLQTAKKSAVSKWENEGEDKGDNDNDDDVENEDVDKDANEDSEDEGSDEDEDEGSDEDEDSDEESEDENPKKKESKATKNTTGSKGKKGKKQVEEIVESDDEGDEQEAGANSDDDKPVGKPKKNPKGGKKPKSGKRVSKRLK